MPDATQASETYAKMSAATWDTTEREVVYYQMVRIDSSRTGYGFYRDSDGDFGIAVYESKADAADQLRPEGVFERTTLRDVFLLCMKMNVPYVHIFRDSVINTVRLDDIAERLAATSEMSGDSNSDRQEAAA